MRIFFAIEFPDKIKNMLKGIGNELKSNSVSGNFTAAANFHLTVKFIGEVNAKELEKLKKALDRAIVDIQSFNIRFTRLGEFSRGEKKLIWAGIENSDNCLINLFNSLEKELELAGYGKDERNFRPHITIGREVKLKEGFDYRKIDFETQDIMVDRVTIMESLRVNGKLVYKPVYYVNM